MAEERCVCILTVLEHGARMEVRDDSELPITVDVTWDDRLQLLAAVSAGLGAFCHALRQRRR